MEDDTYGFNCHSIEFDLSYGRCQKSQRYFKAQQKSLGLVNGHIEEMYSAHTIVKAFNGEEDSLRTFKEYNDQLYTSAWKSQFLSGLMMPLTNLIGNIGYVGVCILGDI